MSSLRNLDFRRLWGAYSVSAVGSKVTSLAVPLIALNLLECTPLELGFVTACGYLPFVLFGLPVGVFVDHVRLVPLLERMDLGRALLLVLVPLAFVLDCLSTTLLCTLLFVQGTMTVFADTAHPSLLPMIVEPSKLVDANGKLEASHSIAEIAGPALAGSLVAWIGGVFAVVVDALSFVLSWLLIRGVREPSSGSAETSSPPRGSFVKQIREGFAWVAGHPVLRPLVLCMAAANFFDLFGMVQVLLPLYAFDVLEMSASHYGVALGLANVGALAGIAANEKLVRTFRLGPVLIAMSLLPGFGVLFLLLATESFPPAVLALGMATAGFGIAVFNVNQMTVRQRVTPPALQGRMHATVRFLIWGMIPAGALAGGALADLIGVSHALTIAGLGSLLSSIPLFLSDIARLGSAQEMEMST